MKLTHWQYLAGLNMLQSPCLTVSHVTRAGICLTCGHDPNRDYKMRFTCQSPMPSVARIPRRPKAKRGRPMPKATRALLGL